MEEEERHSDLFLEFAFRNDGLKKKKGNDSQSGVAVFLSSIHPVKKANARSNLPMIDLQSQNSRGISPYFQKKKTLECNSNRIISPYFQKAVKEGEDRDSEAPLESESRGISPYFQKKRRMVSDSIACSGSDSNSQRLISPYFQKAVKQEERYSEEHCNFPNETDNKKKKKKKRKRKGNDAFESLKEERKINVQNAKMDDQKMGVELPVFNSNSSSERKVSPFCQKAVKEEEEMNLEAQVDSKPTVVSPYFEKKKRAVSDSVANSSSDSNSQRLVSPYFQKAVKQQERNPEEHCNFPNKIERRKTKKRKRKGNDTVESFKEQKKKINVQNVRVEDQKMEVQQPISSSNSNSQKKVSPYCQRTVKEEEEGNSEEETKKGHENEESFKEEGKRKTNAQNVTMEDEKMKLPKKKSRAPPIRVVSPYFPINEEDAKKPVRQNVRVEDQKMEVQQPISSSNSNSQKKVSPYCQRAVKEEEEGNSEEETKKGHENEESFKEEGKRKTNAQNVTMKDEKMKLPKKKSRAPPIRVVSPYFPINEEDAKKPVQQNVRVEDQKMEVQQPISSSNSNSQKKVSPYCQRAVKEEEEGNSEEETKKGHENEESFKEEGKRKTNAQNVTMEDEKMKLPKKKSRAPPIRVVSPYFPINEEDAKKPVRAMFFNKLNVAYRRKSPDNNWKPPPSHFHLLQEDHYHDPWRVMVICMLLNCTSGLQASRVISDLFTLCPDAKTATDVPTEMIEKVIETLGLQKKRAAMIQRFSREYLDDSWTHVTQLHGIGKYAADAYAIFCSGDWGLVVPNDHMLVKYRKYLHQVITPYGSQKQ